jgi:hypothetical protein
MSEFKLLEITLMAALVAIGIWAALGMPGTSLSGSEIALTREQLQERSRLKDLMKRGKILRKIIDEEYYKMAEADSISSAPDPASILTDIFLAHIPIGSSFDDAEEVLRAAGFKVGPRCPGQALGKKPCSRAMIEPYIYGTDSYVTIKVLLEPSNPEDWRQVAAATALIFRSRL